MEPDGSLPYSQDSAAGPCARQIQFTPSYPVPFFYPDLRELPAAFYMLKADSMSPCPQNISQ